MRQHNVLCVCVHCVERYVGLQSSIPLHTGTYEFPEDEMNNDRNMLELF
jgi:hypothetical protein